jgi:hypothetical protein
MWPPEHVPMRSINHCLLEEPKDMDSIHRSDLWEVLTTITRTSFVVAPRTIMFPVGNSTTSSIPELCPMVERHGLGQLLPLGHLEVNIFDLGSLQLVFACES